MITRIVIMKFREECVGDFLNVFNSTRDKIRAFEGCLHLELLNDVNEPNTFVTLSKWENESVLNKYRDSELFKTTWAKTKILFSDKAKAYSLSGEFGGSIGGISV